MRNGWQTKHLGDIAEVQSGGTPLVSNKLFWNGDIPWYSSGELNSLYTSSPERYISSAGLDASNAKLFPAGSLLIGMYDTAALKMSILDREGTFNQAIVGVKPNENINLLFIYYAINSMKERILGQRRGVRQKNLSLGKMRNIELNLPPLSEQQRIVGILDEAFAGIATAKANAEKNRQNARALFESHLQAVFTQRGEGWIEKSLGELCSFVRGPFGGSLKKSIFVADGYAVYEQQHAIYDQFDDIRYFVDEAKFKEMKRFELHPNDLIMSCSGTMGRVAIVPKGIKRGIINQALLKLTPTNKILNTFLKLWMGSQAFQDALKEYSGGAAIQNVASVKVLKDIKIPLPSTAEQQRVVGSIEAISAETQRLESIYQQKLAALDELKQALLHRAFSGEL